jgi:hypothetical protein
MDRRKALKALVVGSAASGALLSGCKTEDKKVVVPNNATTDHADRMAEEVPYNKKLQDETFFTPNERATIGVLCDIIIPKDEKSGSATDAKVPDFIEFIVKDKPEHQTPLRGGLRWLDLTSIKLYEKPFKDCSEREQLELVTKIAYPKKALKDMQTGVSFFSLMRNLTVTGFYTTEIGFKDLEYAGNTPNQWNGVPDAVLKQYNLAYSEKELKECINYDKT